LTGDPAFRAALSRQRNFNRPPAQASYLRTSYHQEPPRILDETEARDALAADWPAWSRSPVKFLPGIRESDTRAGSGGVCDLIGGVCTSADLVGTLDGH